jgi:hypothetical protein
LDAGSVAVAVADALRVAAAAGPLETTASAALAIRKLRIMSLPELA